MALVRSLLDGHRTKTDGLTEGLALHWSRICGSVAFIPGAASWTQVGKAASREEIFIRTLPFSGRRRGDDCARRGGVASLRES